MRKTLTALTLLACLFLHKRPAEALTNFPTSLDSNTTLFQVAIGDTVSEAHHNNLKDAILALEAKLGTDGSAVATSLDYLVTNPASVDPGHSHTGTSVSFEDGDATTPGLVFGNPVTDSTTGLFHDAVGEIAVSSQGVEIVRVGFNGVSILDATGADFPLDVAGVVRIQGANSLCFGGTGASDNDTCIARSAAHVASLAGSLIVQDQAVGDNSLVIRGVNSKTGEFARIFLTSGDTQPIYEITETGVHFFGVGGSTAPDTNLFRSTADTLRTDDSFIVGTNLSVLGLGTQSIGGAASVVNLANSVVTITDAATNLVTVDDVTNFVFSTGTGTKFGTATTQKIAFYNATPVAQPSSTAELKGGVLSALGFVPDGSATALDLDGGNFTTTGTVTIGSSGAAITRTLTGSASLDFAAPGAVPGCSADLTVTVTNAALGNPVVLGVPNASVADLTQQFTAWVSATNTVTVRNCQFANAAANPAAGTFNIRVIQ